MFRPACFMFGVRLWEEVEYSTKNRIWFSRKIRLFVLEKNWYKKLLILSYLIPYSAKLLHMFSVNI